MRRSSPKPAPSATTARTATATRTTRGGTITITNGEPRQVLASPVGVSVSVADGDPPSEIAHAHADADADARSFFPPLPLAGKGPREGPTLAPLPLLRLLQLVSPALPIGAFAYSQGLESAVAAGWVRDEASAASWIAGLLETGIAALDLPLLARLHRAWTDDDQGALTAWSAFLHACRPSAELQAEERHLGASLARLLHSLGVAGAAAWAERADVTYATMFALAACRWDIPLPAATHGYAFAWLEAQVSAAVRLVPLGQSAGQRILLGAGALIPRAAAAAGTLADDDLGAAAPSHAIASAHHETQYSRLFRS